MMKLSVMANGMRSVAADWSWPLAETVAQPWRFDPGSIHFWRASANFVAVLRQNGRRHFLRFNLESERPGRAVEAEARLVDWLADKEIPVARPIRSTHGHLVERIETELGTVNAILFEGLEGPHPETDQLDEAGFRQWGQALAKLHNAMARWQDPGLADRESWQDHLRFAAQYIAPHETALLEERRRLEQWGAALPTGPAVYGLIHFDFETDNLCRGQHGLSMLDFDDCAQHWYAADIAYALRDLWQEGATLADPRVRDFVAGYREWRPVDDALLGELPTFMRLHRLHQFGRLVRALDLQPDGEYPEWLRKLETKLTGRVERYRATLS